MTSQLRVQQPGRLRPGCFRGSLRERSLIQRILRVYVVRADVRVGAAFVQADRETETDPVAHVLHVTRGGGLHPTPFVAGEGASGWPVESLITVVRTPLILLMAVGQSPARSAISASTSRISRPVERLIGESRPVYFVGKSQGTYWNSAVGTAGFVRHLTRGSPVLL